MCIRDSLFAAIPAVAAYNKYLKDKVERFEENRISTLKEARKRLIIWLFYIFFTSFIVYFLYKNFLELNRDIVAFTT